MAQTLAMQLDDADLEFRAWMTRQLAEVGTDCQSSDPLRAVAGESAKQAYLDTWNRLAELGLVRPIRS